MFRLNEKGKFFLFLRFYFVNIVVSVNNGTYRTYRYERNNGLSLYDAANVQFSVRSKLPMRLTRFRTLVTFYQSFGYKKHCAKPFFAFSPMDLAIFPILCVFGNSYKYYKKEL